MEHHSKVMDHYEKLIFVCLSGAEMTEKELILFLYHQSVSDVNN